MIMVLATVVVSATIAVLNTIVLIENDCGLAHYSGTCHSSEGHYNEDLQYLFIDNDKFFSTRWRRILWTIFVIGGIGYTAFNVYKNTRLYLSYPTKFEMRNENHTMKFPKITVCLNSMHSKVNK